MRTSRFDDQVIIALAVSERSHRAAERFVAAMRRRIAAPIIAAVALEGVGRDHDRSPRTVNVRAEFAIYPFRAGDKPPSYVQAATKALATEGLRVEFGVLGQVVTGELGVVLDALRSAQEAAFAAGATNIVLNLEIEG